MHSSEKEVGKGAGRNRKEEGRGKKALVSKGLISGCHPQESGGSEGIDLIALSSGELCKQLTSLLPFLVPPPSPLSRPHRDLYPALFPPALFPCRMLLKPEALLSGRWSPYSV